MASMLTFRASPCLWRSSKFRHGPSYPGRIHTSLSDAESSAVLSADSDVNGAPYVVKEIEKMVSSITPVDGGNGNLKYKKREEELVVNPEKLEPLWEDGFGSASMKDYLDIAKDLIKSDGGPPRWFCPVECGRPLKDSPLLLFLPGIDGVGLGLIMHHSPLGRVFEVRCMHIPTQDRTSFEGLVDFVEQTVRQEHASSPDKPIYLVGDSFGGCLALTIAARNPTVDLVLILANPTTPVERSQLQPLFPLLEALPDELHIAVPYLLSFVMGEPVKMAMANVNTRVPPAQVLRDLSANLTGLLPRLSVLSDIIPKDTLLWKLKLLKSAAAYTNARLRRVKAQVLILASGKDNLLPSGEEAKRLSSVLKDCTVRNFKENGHTLLLEDGINLLTVIKGTEMYRRSKRINYVTDFLPPSRSEFNHAFQQINGFFNVCTSPVMLSTLSDGTIVHGLAGVPSEGPVLLVGYHMLLGMELGPMIEAFLSEKRIMVRGLAHPELFTATLSDSSSEFSYLDYTKVFGALPVTGRNFFKLLKEKSHVLLYPGGAREALHRKGEAYKLFWPEEPEFVRMAAQFGATIVPFGAVGEDDVTQMLLDYDDLMRIPLVNDYLKQTSQQMTRVRADKNGEAANEDLFMPVIAPKAPGRFYYHFGKPIETRGKKEYLNDKDNAMELYMRVKMEVEWSMAYLLKKREEDPFTGIIDRTVYRAFSAPPHNPSGVS
uniref:Esterase/lipase/thioesterase family protein n=1 Tax=Rheum australe TaxID=284363 RepID=B5M1Y5_RHEAU|nr:esterase/lipase/thioesterase family protein [Rheum australe]